MVFRGRAKDILKEKIGWNYIKWSIKARKAEKRNMKKKWANANEFKTVTMIAQIDATISIITIYVNGPNIWIKRQRLAERIKTKTGLKGTNFQLQNKWVMGV